MTGYNLAILDIIVSDNEKPATGNWQPLQKLNIYYPHYST